MTIYYFGQTSPRKMFFVQQKKTEKKPSSNNLQKNQKNMAFKETPSFEGDEKDIVGSELQFLSQ